MQGKDLNVEEGKEARHLVKSNSEVKPRSPQVTQR